MHYDLSQLENAHQPNRWIVVGVIALVASALIVGETFVLVPIFLERFPAVEITPRA